jgi:hypothetical protein
MERDELADDRMAFMAGEVGCVVFELIYNGIEINEDNIVGFLEGKRKAVGNVIHKGCYGMRLRWYGRANKNPARWPGDKILFQNKSVQSIKNFRNIITEYINTKSKHNR